MMAFKVRFPLLLLLGVVLLALVCASASAISSHEGREGIPPRHRESGGQRERAHQEGEREEEERRYQPRHHKSQREEPEEDEEEEERQHRHRPQHKREEDEGRHQREREEEDEEDEEGQQHYRPHRHQREREDDEEEDQQQRNPRRGQEEEDEDEEEREHGAGRRHRRSRRQHAGEREDEEEQRPSRHRGRGREEDEDEDEEDDRRRPEERERRRRSRESERHRGGRQRRSRDDDDEEEGSSSQDRKNPFLLRSNRFQTLLKNENGQIRLLQRFDKRSNLFENLQNYRLLEYRSKPNTLLLPQHYDADFILVVLRGKAILTVVNPKERNSFNLERGDAIKIPAGTLAYLANRDNEQDLRVVDLAIPVNRPGQFQPFYPSSSENQQSYFRGFSKDILEASFNTNIEEIERVLLEEQQQEEQTRGQRRGRKERHQQQEQEGQDEANNNPIVRVSREQIEELSKNAKSSSKKKSESSKSEPFNLRSRDPIYSNKFGQFFQITPKQSPQLKDLDLYLTSVQINEGALLLPHYNSRGTVILVINEGKGNIELVGVRNEQQQQHQQQEEEEDEEDEDDQRSRQVKRYRARVSPGDVFIIPSSHPVAIKASSNSNLSYVGFGINAENNQRNFLAGEEDNVISQIHKPVKELAFPGSAQDVDKLIKNQKQSYFANAQPEQKEGQKRSRGPLSSILGAFY